MASSSVSTEKKASTSAKLLYRPVGLVSGILGGLLASMIFKQIWKRVSPGHQSDAPGPLQTEYSFKEILLAAVVQGALYATIKAIITRQGARAFEKATGEWPGS